MSGFPEESPVWEIRDRGPESLLPERRRRTRTPERRLNGLKGIKKQEIQVQVNAVTVRGKACPS